jgi:hypothetical protein
VLIEDVVRYVGSNGQRLHHHVVRALPGGDEGFAVGEGGKHTASVNLGKLRKALDTYLTEFAAKRPFRDDERPMDLSWLRVVAFVQDDDSREILAARQVDVPEASRD